MNGNSTFFSEGQDGLCSPPVHGVGQAQLLQDHWQRIPDHGRILEKSKEQINKKQKRGLIRPIILSLSKTLAYFLIIK